MSDIKRRIAFFLPTFPAGGQEHTTLLLMKGLVERGHRVELLLERKVGAYLERVPESIPVHELKRRSRWSGYPRFITGWPSEALRHFRGSIGLGERSIPLHRLIALVDYMEAQHPDVIISAHDRAPLLAQWAAGISRHRVATVVIERSIFSRNYAASRTDARTHAVMQHRLTLMRRLYPATDQLFAVSNGAAADLADILNLPRDAVRTMYNPVLRPELTERAAEPLNDPWVNDRTVPLIVTAGRLAPEKAQHVLIDAFAQLLDQGQKARLVILGEGPERENLTRQIAENGLESSVRLPGWADNPYAWMAASALCVLPSEFEGLPNTLIEAMACGCPVVATDCPGGTREILVDGEYGQLVPVGDSTALAAAMAQTLANPPAPDHLYARASDFSLERAIDAYEIEINRLAGSVSG
ncbi:glycoprotein 3-alpha-L-fucosyltransferase [Salinisphaera shabanensis E1L3A]|uniref:Glycoprotein 3-alpha-L-fucosyltransferase n=1 Tax=Salinisphaera shabanensis E1L3A TaxID=1033802 RepID=U2E362_9GAMM|nr:glycosyltransferase [Salinisphaera shabanensis]ERJ18326.1 glycoprotein 3-alpha-L-fucosyltransferase [Salinisphaera shabanensis E1L3A]